VDDTPALQLAQPVADQVGACTGQGAVQVGEALGPEQQFAHDEQGPALPGGTRRMGPEQNPGHDLVVGHFTDPEGHLIGLASAI
jgi:hypothetical protein